MIHINYRDGRNFADAIQYLTDMIRNQQPKQCVCDNLGTITSQLCKEKTGTDLIY